MQIIVSGMHRSGTSAVARVINLMGANIGDHEALMPPQPYNPRGYWERTDVAKINDGVLRSAGASWWKIAGFDVGSVPRSAVESFEADAARVLVALESCRPWVVKDPRFCLLLPFWLRLLERPVCVFVHRNPVEVAHSLNERDGFSLTQGVAIWEQYVLSWLRYSRHVPRTSVSYEDLIADPEGSTLDLLRRLRDLDVQGLEAPEVEELAAFVDPDLRHHRDLPFDSDGLLNDAQVRLVRAMRDGSALRFSDIPALSVGAMETLDSHRRLDAVIQRDAARPNAVGNPDEVTESLDRVESGLSTVIDELRTFADRVDPQFVELRDRHERFLERMAVHETRARLRDHWRMLPRGRSDVSTWPTEADAGRILQLRSEHRSARAGERAAGWRLKRLEQRATEALERRDVLVHAMAGELGRISQNPLWRIARGIGQAAEWMRGRDSLRKGDRVFESLLRSIESEPLVGGGIAGPAGPAADRHQRKLDEFKDLVISPPTTDGLMDLLSEHRRAELRSLFMRRRQDALVSILMPTFNRGRVIASAIASVRDQSYSNWELIIVDDGSDDDTASVVKPLSAEDPRIAYRHIEHRGVSAARNEGLKAASGEITAFLDSDNLWEQDHLLFIVNAIVESGRGCAYGALRVIDRDQNGAQGVRRDSFDPAKLERCSTIDLNIFACRSEVVEDLGGFDEQLEGWVEWDLIQKYVRVYSPAQIPVVLGTLVRRRGLGQITPTASRGNRFKVLNKHLIDWETLELEAAGRLQHHVTIVIPVFGQIELTRRCLESVAEHSSTGRFDVVVVDNGNTEEDRLELKKLLDGIPRSELVANPDNYMYALGCNLGVAKSRGEYVVLLNSDTEVRSGWLDSLIKPLRDDPEIGIVGPKLLFPNDTLQCGGLVFSDRSEIPYHIYSGFPKEHAAVSKPRFFQAVTGACMAFRATDFVKLRGMDPLFMNGCEDVDFCLRMQRDLEKLVFYNPASEIRHHEGKSTGRNRFVMQNRRLFADRWKSAVVPDDRIYYAEDGLRVDRYEKTGREPHGDTAVYEPVFAVDSGSPAAPRLPSVVRSSGKAASVRQLNIGFCSTWHVRGVTFVTKQLADSLEGPGLRTHVFGRWQSDHFFNQEPVYHPRVLNAGDDPDPKEIVDWARSNNLDLVVFVEVHLRDWKRVEALRDAGIRVMCYEHLDMLGHRLWGRYEVFEAFLHNSFYSREIMREKFPSIPSLTVPWAIDATSTMIGTGVEDTRIRGNGPIRFVHVSGWGGFANRKNSDLVLRAFARARDVNAELHFYSQAGIEHFGEAYAEIVRCDPRIHLFQGTHENIFGVYRSIDVLLCPSKREGLGLPILEALVCGVPVLVSDGYMMKQWLIPGQHGFICPATPKAGAVFLPEMQVDEQALSDMIAQIASDRATLDEMRHQIRNDRHVWTWSWQREVLRDQVRRIVEEPGYAPPEDLSYIPDSLKEFERRRADLEDD